MPAAAGLVLVALSLSLWALAGDGETEVPPLSIGYSQIRTNIPGSRYANAITTRAWLVHGDGSGARELASELVSGAGTWTQFAGWSPDGRFAIIGRGWESEDNGQWEEQHGEFRFAPEHWLYDTYLLDLAGGGLTNVTGVNRVSHYNTGVFFWPDDPGRLGFQAMVGGEMHPFCMNLDGTGKRDLSGGEAGFSYGYSASPDGTRISYHRDYQVYIADADGGNIHHVGTGNPFNFSPRWSPDGEWLLLLSGEHYDCHPFIVSRDGTGLRKLADRGGWEGVMTVFDVRDHHGGSSDVPAWAQDSRSVYYTAKVGDAVELMRVSLDGEASRLTRSAADAKHYHPSPSPDGRWLLFGSNRSGTRQLYVARADGSEQRAVTTVPEGNAAMWGYWRPVADS